MNKRISIITVCLNASSTIAECLDSVESQSAHVLEHIIVDGGSTDGTLEILQARNNNFTQILTGPDAGISSAFNKGIMRSSGDWIGILNADDWYEPDALKCINERIETLVDDTILHGRLRCWDQSGKVEIKVSGPATYDPVRDFLPEENMPGLHPTCFVPRQMYLQHGLFCESFQIAMDYEFLYRCYKKGMKFQFIPQVITNMRAGGHSSMNHGRIAREMLAARILNGQPLMQAFTLHLRRLFKNWKKKRK